MSLSATAPRNLLLLMTVLATPAALAAQTSDGGAGAALTPSMATSVNNMHMTIRRNLIEAAQAMRYEV